MKTETLAQQSTVGVHASACFASIFTAPNPNDSALVPQDSPVSAFSVAEPSSLVAQPSKKPRNGKIARLPKPVRDVVNRMLFNHVKQENIVEALAEIGIKVTQRNISNWKTRGGYREWCLAQEYAIQLHSHQDNLLDTVRRHDGSELPEVGLQAAATQLSRFFLTPEADKLIASDPKEYERRVSMLNRISAQLKGLQKYRDDCARNLGPRHDPARIQCEAKGELHKLRHDWSCKVGYSPQDPQTPHRNELPDQRELFHLLPPEPPRLLPTFEEWKAYREREAKKAAAKSETQAQPTAPTPSEAQSAQPGKSAADAVAVPAQVPTNEVLSSLN